MVGGLVFLVANRLELESAVRDVEVPTQAFAQPVQHFTGTSTMTCADSTGTPPVIVQACRSWTSTTPTYSLDVLTDFGKVHTVRYGFQQHVDDLTQQRPGARDDHHHDEKGSDRVKGGPARDQDQHSGGDDSQRTDEVTDTSR